MKQIKSNEEVETGGLRFGDDWPGFFLRGDDALYLASLISSAFAMGDADELSLMSLKIYADQIFNEVPFSQWVDEDGHSIIQAVNDKEDGDLKIEVHRDGVINIGKEEQDGGEG